MAGSSAKPRKTTLAALWPRILVPNAITLCAVAVGLGMVVRAEFDWALFLLCLFLDVADGATARALDAATDIGAMFDSAADAVNFALLPALLLPHAGLLARVVFCASGWWRLIRFSQGQYRDVAEGVFIGVPTPLASTLCFLAAELASRAIAPLWLVDVALLLLALLEHAPVRLPMIGSRGATTFVDAQYTLLG
jgi:CDP-diacylglycerol---serine O-phosphatidyltransferase